MKYNRILLKLSGEALASADGYSLDYAAVRHFAAEVKDAVTSGVEVGGVIGGGNIFRGVRGAGKGFDRRQGDYMGMLATVINALALQTLLEDLGVKTKILSALAIEGLGEKIFFKNADRYLKKGYVVIFGGGTGNPYFTTDSGAALRAVEIKADILLKGTRVDGIYTADPEKVKDVQKYSKITFEEAYSKNLKIMDLTAFTLCSDNNMNIYVYDATQKGNLLKVLNGENIGTLVHN
jgi:uridylate kinase